MQLLQNNMLILKLSQKKIIHIFYIIMVIHIFLTKTPPNKETSYFIFRQNKEYIHSNTHGVYLYLNILQIQNYI